MDAGKMRLEFIDALRGLACFAVLVFHAALWRLMYLPEGLVHSLVNVGWVSVDLFLTISGFCLALPFFRSDNRPLVFGEWMRRRAWRVIPPYLAALGIAVFFQQPHSALDMILHVLLLHNLLPETAHTVNGPAWTMALEFQLYLVAFAPFLWLIRRFGPIVLLLVAGAVSLGNQVVYYRVLGGPPGFPLNMSISTTLPLMAFCFATGMIAAWLVTHPEQSRRWRIPGVVAVALSLVFITVRLAQSPDDMRYAFGNELAIGVLCAALLVALAEWSCTEALMATRPFRAICAFGVFSYSVYLIHGPVLIVLGDRMPINIDPGDLVITGIVLAGTIALGYVFHLLFERPFMTKGVSWASLLRILKQAYTAPARDAAP